MVLLSSQRVQTSILRQLFFLTFKVVEDVDADTEDGDAGGKCTLLVAIEIEDLISASSFSWNFIWNAFTVASYFAISSKIKSWFTRLV